MSNDSSGQTKIACKLCGGLGIVGNADLFGFGKYKCPKCKGTGYDTSSTTKMETNDE